VSAALVLATAALAAWLYLLLLRGFFWVPKELPPPLRGRVDRMRSTEGGKYPSVAIIVPARDEAETIGAVVGSLLAQDYRGDFRIVLVDDHSTDGTARIALEAAEKAGACERLTVIAAAPLPPGWTGKLWALNAGMATLEASGAAPDLLLFTDADIAHAPDNLSSLVAALEDGRRDLVSLMVKLRCETWAERFLVPAFVFFFAMIYPFAWVGDREKRTAAAAGGCVLLRRAIYHRAGGLAAIRGALIDDCALARAVKDKGGVLHLAMTQGTRSLRPYPRIGDMWAMVARSAYTQLGHSPPVLAATALGLAIVFLAPPLLLAAGGEAAALALAAWALMAACYAPMLRFYRRSLLFAPLLPLAAAVYLGATLDSARRHYAGKGGAWKGRVQWQSQR
jgi:hopene-associated glycosyltransferase HpnB